MYSKNSRSKSQFQSNSSFKPLLPNESSIQYLNYYENSSHKKEKSGSEFPTKEQNLGIYIRIRPLIKSEHKNNFHYNREGGFLKVFDPQTIQITDPEHQNTVRKWNFHEIFNQNSSQTEVFTSTCAPMIETVLQGYNASMFVYGQTGTGKTHTMGLLSNLHEKSEGLVPLSLQFLFQSLPKTGHSHWEVGMSFYQIYLDEIHDLLNPHKGKNLLIKEDATSGEPYIKDLTIVTLENASQAFQLINAGLGFRNIEATKHNDTSSRSHVVLTINVLQKSRSEVLFSKANFIDLAGSERMTVGGGSKSGNIKMDRRAEETRFINSSLSTLGTIIASLNEKGGNSAGSDRVHVAYRNSKLTRILQTSLSGDSKVFLIATISPLQEHLSESISTCVFAARCKELKVRPSLQTMQIGSPGDEISRVVEYYEHIIENQKGVIKSLEEEIKTIRSGQTVAVLNEDVKDLNEYLCKLLYSIKWHISNEFQQLSLTKIHTPPPSSIEEKFPGAYFDENRYVPVQDFDYNEFSHIDTAVNKIQSVSRDILDMVDELLKGSKSLIAFKQDTLLNNQKRSTSSFGKDVEGFYRIIAFLLKEASFTVGGGLENEAKGLEKIRNYIQKFSEFMERLYGKPLFNTLFPDFEQKIEVFLKKTQPLSVEGEENKDTLMKTLKNLRQYSNNSFTDIPIIPPENSLNQPPNPNALLLRQNSQESKNSLSSKAGLVTSQKSLKDLTMSKKQQRLLVEKSDKNESNSKENKQSQPPIDLPKKTLLSSSHQNSNFSQKPQDFPQKSQDFPQKPQDFPQKPQDFPQKLTTKQEKQGKIKKNKETEEILIINTEPFENEEEKTLKIADPSKKNQTKEPKVLISSYEPEYEKNLQIFENRPSQQKGNLLNSNKKEVFSNKSIHTENDNEDQKNSVKSENDEKNFVGTFRGSSKALGENNRFSQSEFHPNEGGGGGTNKNISKSNMLNFTKNENPKEPKLSLKPLVSDKDPIPKKSTDQGLQSISRPVLAPPEEKKDRVSMTGSKTDDFYLNFLINELDEK